MEIRDPAPARIPTVPSDGPFCGYPEGIQADRAVTLERRWLCDRCDSQESSHMFKCLTGAQIDWVCFFYMSLINGRLLLLLFSANSASGCSFSPVDKTHDRGTNIASFLSCLWKGLHSASPAVHTTFSMSELCPALSEQWVVYSTKTMQENLCFTMKSGFPLDCPFDQFERIWQTILQLLNLSPHQETQKTRETLTFLS